MSNSDLISSVVFRVNKSLIKESLSFSLWQIEPSLIFLICLGCIIFYIIRKIDKKWLFWFFVGFAFLSLSSTYIKPQDDLYSNLLTVFNFRKYGLFSVSSSVAQEGSFEYLYFFIVSLISGANKAFILYFSVGLSAACLFGASFYLWKIIKNITESEDVANLSIFILISSGYFFNNLFCGYGYNFFILFFFIALFLLFEEKRAKALFVLACLPLIRHEVLVLYPVVLGVLWFFERDLTFLKNVWKAHLAYFISVIFPFMFRFLYYGHLLSVPGVSKNNSLFYLRSWFYGFYRLWIVVLPLIVIFVLFALFKYFRLKEKNVFKITFKKNELKKMSLMLFPIAVLTFIYKVNGGDFLFMNRYDLLFFFGLIVVFAYFFSRYKKNLKSKELLFCLVVILFISCFFKGPLLDSAKGWFLNAKKSNAKVLLFRKVNYFNDIEAPYKEGLSLFFNEIYPDEIKNIVVVEVNTFGFFSKHNIYDMFGSINKDIAFLRSEPRVDLYPGYKKRNPKLLEKYNAEIIIGKHANYWNYNPSFLKRIINAKYLDYTYFGWDKGGHEFELGGEQYLKSLGYIPVLLVFDNISFSFRIKEHYVTKFYKHISAKYYTKVYVKKYLMERSELSLNVY